MHLPRHTIESHADVPLFEHASFCSPAVVAEQTIDSGALPQPAIFSCASLNGFTVSQTDPLKLVSNRTWSSSQGGLSHAVPIQHTSLLFLVGGGRVPRFAPNKVILWDEAAEYTANESARTAHSADSDDDELGSAHSRRASTVFSAGSEFDAYGIDDSNGSEHIDDAKHNDSRSVSPQDSLRFSASSLMSAKEQGRIDGSTSSSSSTNAHALERSLGASSLGIRRLHASSLPEESDSSDRTSHRPDRASMNMESSLHTGSIASSSANLDDPFQEGQEAQSVDASTPSVTLPLESPQIRQGETSSRLAKSSLSPTSLFSGKNMRHPDAEIVDSVSSLATTATHATTKVKSKILHGREVAELEFSEVVRGIYTTSVHQRRTELREGDYKGKSRASSETFQPPRFCVVLVVVLASKTVVFELSPGSTAGNLDGTSSTPAWVINKRTAVQTFQNRKGLGSVAPYCEESLVGPSRQATAIVAVPGRQKGHVQLLIIKLQGLTTPETAPNLSNATSSVGAASIIVAHESSLAAITLSPDGHLLATASSKGTLIRIWLNKFSDAASSGAKRTAPSQGSKSDIPGRTGFGARLIRELRRGTDPATILSIAFTSDASMVAAASDKGTIHVFRLCEPSHVAGVKAGDQAQPPPSISSRTANLGRAAAQYLPSGLGNLASQIPPSVYPQYLKSEWSSAQFRIPLKRFGASSRHYTPPSTKEPGGMHGFSTTTAAPVGTEKSTEGAWAQMRSRISDVRKGEASVDENVFLCWVAQGSTSSDGDTGLPDRGSRATKGSSREGHARYRAPSQRLDDSEGKSSDAEHAAAQHHLIALTTSGGWYKLAVTLPKSDVDETVTGSTVLDMYRRDASSRLKQPTPLECRLVETRPMAALLDGWRA